MHIDNGNPFVWEDPPPVSNGQHIDTSALAAQLMSEPGRWARIRAYANDDKGKRRSINYSANIRKGYALWARPAGAFESTIRVVDGERVVYVRYVGEALLNGDAR